MDELEALFGDELFDLAQGGEEAALADPGVYPQLGGLPREGSVPEADERDVHAPGEVAQQGVDVRLCAARIASAYEMYHFQVQAPCYPCNRRRFIVKCNSIIIAYSRPMVNTQRDGTMKRI